MLVDQVNRRIDQALRSPRPAASRWWSLALPAVASALALVAIVGGPLLTRWRSGAAPPQASAPAPSPAQAANAPEGTATPEAPAAPEVSADALLRLERNVTRDCTACHY